MTASPSEESQFRPTHEFRAMGRIFLIRVVGDVGYTSSGGQPWARDAKGTWCFKGQRVDYTTRSWRKSAL